MPRSPVTDVARDVRVTIRTTAGEQAEINRLRGSSSVSDYLRGLVRADAARRRISRVSRKDDDAPHDDSGAGHDAGLR